MITFFEDPSYISSSNNIFIDAPAWTNGIPSLELYLLILLTSKTKFIHTLPQNHAHNKYLSLESYQKYKFQIKFEISHLHKEVLHMNNLQNL